MSLLNRLKSSKSIKDVTDQKAPPIETYPLDSNDYSIIGIIGKGAFAKVYGAECKSKNNQKVAIKVIKLENDDNYSDNDKALQISDIQQEAAIMSSLRHSHIVSCYASFVVLNELWLIMPFVSGGSTSYILSHSINNYYKNGIKDEYVICCILRDTLFGLKYMHNQGRIHRDIKGRNILINGNNGIAMLADFGVSGALLEGGLKKRGRNTMTGTPCWMAPEVMKHQRYNHKADIWSLGITALELAFATTPYTKLKSPMKVMMEIMDGKSPTVDSMNKNNKFSKQFKQFVSKCVVKDPTKRLSASELLSHEFIKKYSKDRDFMINNFVKHIQKIQIKPCNQHDLPASVQLKNKNKNMVIKVDQPTNNDPNDNDPNNMNPDDADFSFSTSLSKGDLDDVIQHIKNNNDQNTNDNDPDVSPRSVKKGKFTITTIDDDNNNNNANNSSNNLQNPPIKKKKSRFSVTPVD